MQLLVLAAASFWSLVAFLGPANRGSRTAAGGKSRDAPPTCAGLLVMLDEEKKSDGSAILVASERFHVRRVDPSGLPSQPVAPRLLVLNYERGGSMIPR